MLSCCAWRDRRSDPGTVPCEAKGHHDDSGFPSGISTSSADPQRSELMRAMSQFKARSAGLVSGPAGRDIATSGSKSWC